MVQHLTETPAGTTYDSTSNDNDGTTSGMDSADQVAGQVDGSLDFDGSNDYVNVTGVTASNNNTISLWVNFAVSGTNSYLLDIQTGRIIIGIHSESDTLSYHDGVGWHDSSLVVADSIWHHITAVTNSAGTVNLYVDDNAVYNDNITARSIGETVILGARYSADSDYFNGLIDEVRISNTARHSSWISTEYNNQSDVGSFMSFGTEQSLNRVAIVNAPITNKLTDGLVGHWTFNGPDMDWASSTAEALDRSGNGNNGNVIGAGAVIGKVGQGLDFDGVDDYVGVGTDLFEYQNFSVSTWVYIKGDGAGLADNGIITNVEPTSGDPGWLLIYNTTDNNIRFYAEDGVWQNAASVAVNNNQWYHIVGVADAGILRVYIDGLSSGTTDTYGTIDYTGTTNSYIGVYDTSGDNFNYFNGTIDEVRVYNRALSADEVGELYRAGSRKFRAN